MICIFGRNCINCLLFKCRKTQSFPGPSVSTKSRRINQHAAYFSFKPIWPLFFLPPREFWPLIFSWQYIPITPSVLKARLTRVAAATSQLNPHVYLEKCPSFSGPRTQTSQRWLMVTLTNRSKSPIWATFTCTDNWNSMDHLSLWEPEAQHWEVELF